MVSLRSNCQASVGWGAVLLVSLWVGGCRSSEETPQAAPADQAPAASEKSRAPTVADAAPEEPPAILFHRGKAPVTTGWESRPHKLSADYCQSCHQESHADWQRGMHSQAWTSEIFQRAYAFERHDWCVHCHAPLRRDMKGEEPWADEGINCASCHVREGKILGLRDVAASGPEGHEVVASPYLASSEFCAECHQFNFPRSFENTVSYSHQSMQDTYGEWKLGGFERCHECHYSGHELLGPHDQEWMREQFSDFESELLDGERLHLSFAVAPRGHRTPTGDLFRSLVFRLSGDEEQKELLYEKRWGRFFGTGWIASNEISTHALRRNSGLRPTEKRVSLTIDTPATGPLYGALVFYYHDPFFGGEGKGRDEGSSLTLWTARLR